MEIQYSLQRDYCFGHYNHVTDNNYGVVQIRRSQDEKAFIEYFLVTSTSQKETMSDYNFSFRDVNLVNCCGDDCQIDYLEEFKKNLQSYSYLE